MIESIAVRNFQSLYAVDVTLGQLTVCVGPSSSGKSALLRALRTLIANRRGDSFISQGERLTVITARTSKGTITLQRGKGTADNYYELIPHDDAPSQGYSPTVQRFTKLGGETPEEVSRFLGISAKDATPFASQLDKPFLLDDSPGEVARILGDLTNVRVVFDAARESNRRKLAVSSTLKTRSADLDAITAQVPAFREIQNQTAALDRAEALTTQAQSAEDDFIRLALALDSLRANQDRTEALRAPATMPIPDEQRLVDAYAALAALRDALQALRTAEVALRDAGVALEDAEGALGSLTAEYAEARQGLAAGFESFYIEERGAADMSVELAARLSAQYVESVLD